MDSSRAATQEASRDALSWLAAAGLQYTPTQTAQSELEAATTVTPSSVMASRPAFGRTSATEQPRGGQEKH